MQRQGQTDQRHECISWECENGCSAAELSVSLARGVALWWRHHLSVHLTPPPLDITINTGARNTDDVRNREPNTAAHRHQRKQRWIKSVKPKYLPKPVLELLLISQKGMFLPKSGAFGTWYTLLYFSVLQYTHLHTNTHSHSPLCIPVQAKHSQVIVT